MSVPNQRAVKVGTRIARDKQHTYGVFNSEALRQAMKELTEAELKLWLYLNKNQEGYSWDFSPSACESWGISRASVYRAFNGLLEKGFIVRDTPTSNKYTVYESKQSQSESQ